jgi:hypothetical protein
MFRNACSIAREFTRPVFLCKQAISGACSSGIGSFVIVNDEGWIVTAGHIIEGLENLIREEAANAALMTEAQIDSDPSLSKKQKYDLKKDLRNRPDHATRRAGANWSFPGSQLVDVSRHDNVDLAIGRLEPFDKSWISTYPVFKDPTKDFHPGASLCKYGFPFNSVTPAWDGAANAFIVPGNPLPLFPIEGIFTREIDIVPDGPAGPYNLRYVETSSPGLMGQSGGPTFDVHGAIWAIQSQTHHYALGFNPPVPGAANGESEHQFLNVGWGVHAETVIGVLTELGVRHTVSAF